MALNIRTIAVILASAKTYVSSPTMIGTALRLVLGQSNAVGAETVSDSAGNPNLPVGITKDYGSINPPMTIASVSSGSNATSVFSWYDLLYLQSGQTGNDITEGTVTAPVPTGRGERALQSSPFTASGGVSHLIGVAEKVDGDNYHKGAQAVKIIKAASFGKPIDEQDPYNFTGVTWDVLYQKPLVDAARRATAALLRPYLAAEIAAGRPVYAQSCVWSQGEKEAEIARNDANPAAMAAWAGKFLRIVDYYRERYQSSFPWFVIRLKENDSFTTSQIANLKSVCRYEVVFNGTTGAIVSTTDLGLSSSNRDNVYFLNFGFTGSGGSDVHFSMDQYRVMGKGVVALERQLAGSATAAGLTSFPITTVAPQLVIATSFVSATAGSITVSVSPDETCSIRALALPAGSPAPSQATVLSTGQLFTNVTGDSTPFSITLTGLASATSYDIYTVCVDSVYSMAGSVKLQLAAVSTIAAAGVTFNPAFNTNANLTYSNGNRTATRSNATGLMGLKSTSTRTSGKYYWEVTFGTAVPQAVGVGDSTFATGGSGGTLGITRICWIGSGVLNYDGLGGTGTVTRAMGSAILVGDTVDVCYDAGLKRIWIRRRVPGSNIFPWNNSASANPAAGEDGLRCDAPSAGAMFLVATLPVTSGASVTINTSPSSWTGTPPAGFGVWDNT